MWCYFYNQALYGSKAKKTFDSINKKTLSS